ncbi:MAG: hypothetical protein ACR2RB_21000 [Gammaproteobacteria bacterium]
MTQWIADELVKIAQTIDKLNMIKSVTYLLVVLPLVTVSLVHGAGAATHHAADCTSGEIQQAINKASDGDVVSVPACSPESWDEDVIVPDTKGITLQGAGNTSTMIMLNGQTLYVHTSSARQPVRVTGMQFTPTTTAPAIVITGTAQNWRVDHNIFDNARAGGEASTIEVGGTGASGESFNYGVIDNNRFINRDNDTSIFVEWPRGDLDNVTPGDWIWSQPPQRGTAQAVYIEDNFFEGNDRASQVVDSRWGAKYVLRYNIIHNPWISTHSGCTNGGRNSIWTEIYRNKFTDDENYYGGNSIEMRSTSGVVWSNTATTPLQKFTIGIDHERSWRENCSVPYSLQCDGSRSFDENAGANGYRCLGQPGWGQPQVSDMSAATFSGVFNWGNSDGGVNVDMVIVEVEKTPEETPDYTKDHIKAGREVFNSADMTVGLREDRPLSCSVGPRRSVYVSTDEHEQENTPTLYVCTAAGTWTKHWEPYRYPHPLRSTSRPDAPTNLQIEGMR